VAAVRPAEFGRPRRGPTRRPLASSDGSVPLVSGSAAFTGGWLLVTSARQLAFGIESGVGRCAGKGSGIRSIALDGAPTPGRVCAIAPRGRGLARRPEPGCERPCWMIRNGGVRHFVADGGPWLQGGVVPDDEGRTSVPNSRRRAFRALEYYGWRGDVYQTNLFAGNGRRRASRPAQARVAIYRRLRSTNPSSFCGLHTVRLCHTRSVFFICRHGRPSLP